MLKKNPSLFYVIKIFKNFVYLLFVSISFFSVQSHAASTSWDFDSVGNYTLSNTNSFTLASGRGRLSLNFNHVGSMTNTALNGAYDLIVEGNYAYMTSYLGDRFVVVDISVPTTPVIVGNLANNNGTLRLNGASGLVKNGNYIYIASRVSDAIQIINVSVPTAPVAAGQVLNSPTSNRLNGARALTISGSKLYVASDVDDALAIYDISNPISPVKQGDYRNTTQLNGVRDVKISGNYALVSSYNRDNIAILNISNPNSPSFVTELRDTANLDGAWGIKIIGNYAYVSAYLANAVQIIDISTITAPVLVTTIDNSLGLTLSQPRDIAVSGDILYIAGYGSNNIVAVDVSNPLSPVFINTITNGGSTRLSGAYGVFKSGLNIYAASYTSDAIEIMDLSYATNSPYIIPNTAFDYTGANLNSFSHILSATNSGSITYQISKNNGTTWYYWNGGSWVTTTGGVGNSNTAATINSNISSFNSVPGGTNQFKWKAFFTSNGTQKTEINSITVTSFVPPTPGPGGVGGNLQVWLKADNGPSTAIDGNSVVSWLDRSGNGYDANGGVSPIYRNNSNDALNFNPVIDFNGSSQYLQNLNNGAYTQSYFLVVVPDNTIDGTVGGQVPFGFNCNSGILNAGTCGLDFAGVTLGAFTAAINDEVITQAIGSSASYRGAQIGVASYEGGKPMLIGMNENPLATQIDIYEKGLKVDNYNANTYQSISSTNYALGRSLDNTYPFYYDGKIAEVINYSNRIDDLQRQKIESYLSLKYGITLQDGLQNYIASDGTTMMWSTVAAGVYKNDIFGIGYDSLSQLGQVKSKSVNKDGIITLEAIGEGTNAINSFVDISDKEFLTVSNNGAGNTWTAVGSPNGYYNLSRSWRVQEIGEVGTVTLDFDVDNPNFNVPNLSIGTKYYFVYDSDNDDSLSDETPVAMNNIGGSTWRISGVNLNHLREFTIATQASTNNIPTNILLSNTIVNENISANSLVGTLSTVDADGSDTHIYTLVSGAGNQDNNKVSIIGNNLRLIYSPDYELKSIYNIRVQTDDGNGGQFQKALTITVNDIGEVISSIIDFETDDKFTITSGNWQRDGLNVSQGSFSLRSDIAGNANTQACFIVSHTFATDGTIEFDYNVSSQTGGDFLRFYIDNIEQQNWSGDVAWARYSKNNVTTGFHEYKWCYIKNGSINTGNDQVIIDYITFKGNISDTTDPTISSTNYSNQSLLPGGNHNLIINYFDLESGINTSSDIITINKWDGSSWGGNIAASALNLGSKTVTATQASYPTNNLGYGKYRYNFSISDNDANNGNVSREFYIDKPEININTGSLNVGGITNNGLKFSNDEIIITVKTVGAAFNVNMSQDSAFAYGGNVIINWDGSKGIGYDKTPYSGTNLNINSNPALYSQVANLNINGNYNTYQYRIKVGTLIGNLQAAGNYETSLSFYLNLNY